ncbi:MAG: hypothetical protein Fur0028_13270 [Bacteroidales bacterium]
MAYDFAGTWIVYVYIPTFNYFTMGKSTGPKTNPNYPSTTGKPSGGGRGNTPKPKGK